MALFNSLLLLIVFIGLIVLAVPFQFRFQTKLVPSKTYLQQTEVISYVSFVDFRVGKILEVSPHQTVGRKVYVTKVDVGENVPRTMCAGIAEFIPPEDMINKLVVTCCNLKPRNIEGVVSSGMILVSKDDTFTNWALLVPPEGSAIGEQIQIEGIIKEPLEPGNRATKAMDKVNDDFVVNDENIACYQKQRWSTSAGFVTCPVKGDIS